VSVGGRADTAAGVGGGGAGAPGAGDGDRVGVRRAACILWAFDKVQVKYEMLRAHLVDGETVTAAAATHGYSRASFYLVARAFEDAGMIGLLDDRPGRRGPVKLSAEVVAFLEARRRERPGASGAELADELERALGVRLHRRTVERALQSLGARR
jgi:transposase